MSVFQRRVRVWAVFAALAAVAALGSIGIGAQGSPGVNPGLFGGVYYRPLTVFSRGGRVTAVAGVPSNPQVYYMGSAGGVFKTTDAGVTWIPVTDGQINVGSIGAIAVADSNPDVVYVGTGTAEPRGNVSNGDGVYKSVDAGKTWQHIGLEKAGLIGRIKIHPTDPNIVFVAVVGNCFGPNKERGVYRTKDGGRTWEQVLGISENTGAVDLSMATSTPDTIFAAMWAVRRQPWTIDSGSMDGGIFRSTDGGTKWHEADRRPADDRDGRQDRRVGVAVEPEAGVREHRSGGQPGRRLPIRRRRRDVDADECQPDLPAARVLLHAASSPTRSTRTRCTSPIPAPTSPPTAARPSARSARATATTTTGGSTR